MKTGGPFTKRPPVLLCAVHVAPTSSPPASRRALAQASRQVQPASPQVAAAVAALPQQAAEAVAQDAQPAVVQDAPAAARAEWPAVAAVRDVRPVVVLVVWLLWAAVVQ